MSIKELPQDKDSLYYDWYREKEKISQVIEDALKQPKMLGLTAMGFEGSKKAPVASDFDFERVFLIQDIVEWCFYPYLTPMPEVTDFNEEYNSLVLCGLIEQVVNFETWGRVSGISYGELILGMFIAGYKLKRIPRSKACQFNIDDKNIKYLFKAIEIRMQQSLSRRRS